jgi:sporulation protein YlmC with PRC-barrel domain
MSNLLSAYIGKPLITLAGIQIGVVKPVSISVNYKKIRNLSYFDDNEEEFELPVTAVFAAGDGAVLVRNPKIKPFRVSITAPFSKKIYSEKGNYLGVLQDFEVNENEVLSVICGDKHYGANTIISIGENAVLINLSNMPVKSSRKKAFASLEANKIEENYNKSGTVAGSSLITGKKTKKDIKNAYGEIIIPVGTVITPEIIKKAIVNNKIFELTVSTIS